MIISNFKLLFKGKTFGSFGFFSQVLFTNILFRVCYIFLIWKPKIEKGFMLVILQKKADAVMAAAPAIRDAAPEKEMSKVRGPVSAPL